MTHPTGHAHDADTFAALVALTPAPDRLAELRDTLEFVALGARLAGTSQDRRPQWWDQSWSYTLANYLGLLTEDVLRRLGL